MSNDVYSAILNRHNLQMVEGDYFGKDGLLYCGKCKQVKSFLAPENLLDPKSDLILRNATCKCDQDKEKEKSDAKRREKIAAMRENCFENNSKLRLHTFENAAPKTERLSLCMRYVDHWDEAWREGRGIVFWGNTGVGKTFLAACIANALIDREIKVRFSTMSDILMRMRESFDNTEAYLKSLCNTPELLIIDDLGAERNTEYGTEARLAVIDRRINIGKPLIVTTNISLAELGKPSDVSSSRLYDRILSVCAPVSVNGESRRKENGRSTVEWLRRIAEE